MALLRKAAFRVKNSIRRRLARGKRKNQCRLRDIEWEDQPSPMFSAGNIKYDLAKKAPALACGGIGVMHTLARQSGLIGAIGRAMLQTGTSTSVYSNRGVFWIDHRGG